jgi:hypothetical protein
MRGKGGGYLQKQRALEARRRGYAEERERLTAGCGHDDGYFGPCDCKDKACLCWARRVSALSDELKEEIRKKPHEIAALAQLYWRLKNDVTVVTHDGEKLTLKQYEQQIYDLNKELRAAVEYFGPISVEGQDDLILEPRRTVTYDVDAIRRNDLLWARLLELHCVQIDRKALEAHKAQIAHRMDDFAIVGQETALKFKK